MIKISGGLVQGRSGRRRTAPGWCSLAFILAVMVAWAWSSVATAAPISVRTTVGQDGVVQGLASSTQAAEEKKEGPPTRLGGESSHAETVAVFGDSLADGLWDGLRAEHKGNGLAFVRLGTVSKGLTRPDWREWIVQGADRVKDSGATRVLILLGANDQQGLRDEERKVHAFMSPSWDAIYVDRALELVRVMTEAGADVEWVGLPVMRDNPMDSGARHIDAVLSSAMSGLGVPWVKSSDLFRSAAGGYDPAPGSQAKLRADDGVHFTGTGYRLLAREVWSRAEAEVPK